MISNGPGDAFDDAFEFSGLFGYIVVLIFGALVYESNRIGHKRWNVMSGNIETSVEKRKLLTRK
jgi:hypothetical protein